MLVVWGIWRGGEKEGGQRGRLAMQRYPREGRERVAEGVIKKNIQNWAQLKPSKSQAEPDVALPVIPSWISAQERLGRKGGLEHLEQEENKKDLLKIKTTTLKPGL